LICRFEIELDDFIDIALLNCFSHKQTTLLLLISSCVWFYVILGSARCSAMKKRNIAWNQRGLSASSLPRCSLLRFIAKKKEIDMIDARKSGQLAVVIFGVWVVYFLKSSQVSSSTTALTKLCFMSPLPPQLSQY